MEVLTLPGPAINQVVPCGESQFRGTLFGGRESPPVTRPASTAALVHVAVGRSMEKSEALLRGTFRHYGCTEVILLHVHQPSPTIPTLLGRLPAAQANEDLVSEYRRKEREGSKKLLLSYMVLCYKSQVQANIIMVENENVQQGILDAVVKHGIRKLAIGASPDSCFWGRGKLKAASFIARNAPPFCEICFISRGRHVWTKESNEGAAHLLSSTDIDGAFVTDMVMTTSPCNNEREFLLTPERNGYFSHGLLRGENLDTELVFSVKGPGITESPTCTLLRYVSTGKYLLPRPPNESSSTANVSEDDWKSISLHKHIEDLKLEAEKSKEKAFTELLKRKTIELETSEAINRAKASQASYLHEASLRERLEEQVECMKQKFLDLAKQKNRLVKELESATKDITSLKGRAQELASCKHEAAKNLDLVQASLGIMTLERHNREQGSLHCARRRQSNNALSRNYKRFAFGNDSFNFTEFSLSDLQNATCDFSESFKLGQGAYGCVYKGEMLNRTVAIKKLHAHNVQSLSEFEQEVYVLGKLRHPHLVTLIGVCAEALCLVYEYLPTGTLHDCLFSRKNAPLTWEVRIRIAAQMSSALVFLHSSKPKKIIHGDLKPGNILLDSNFNCKISDFGICRLVPEDTKEYPLVRRDTGPKGMFSYSDPEYQRTSEWTPKSDVYSFGIILLQLLAGKPPAGLINEVRRSLSSGQLSSIHDQSAGEWPISVARKLAEFGLKCTEMNSRDRPELTPAVVRELEELYVPEQCPVPPYFLCPILQEIMHDPQVAADGFTYEGSAIRGWLQNGRETSPLTNLKLEHLNLIPNNALKFAIHDWLCRR